MAGQAPPELIALVATDEEIQRKVKRLILTSLDEADWQLKHGNPATRAAIMRQAVPALLSAMKQDKENDELAEMKRVYQELREAFQNYATPELVVPEPKAAIDVPEIIQPAPAVPILKRPAAPPAPPAAQ